MPGSPSTAPTDPAEAACGTADGAAAACGATVAAGSGLALEAALPESAGAAAVPLSVEADDGDDELSGGTVAC